MSLALSLIALFGALMAFADDGDEHALAWTAGFSITSAVLFPWSLYQIIRHTPAWNWAIFTAMIAILTASAIAYFSGCDKPKTFAAVAGPFIGVGVAMWAWDGLNRTAAAVPTTVGVVVLAIIGGCVALWAHANSPSSNSRSTYY